MNPKLARLGLSEADAVNFASFAGWAQRAGWSDAHIEKAASWYKTAFRPGMTEDEMLISFSTHAEQNGLPLNAALNAADWRDQVIESGPEKFFPPRPPLAADEKRLAEIREIARTNPDAYDRDRALQEQEWEIQARRTGEANFYSGEAPSTTPGIRVADIGAKPSGTDRLTEIRELRKSDPDRYDRDKALQQEELGLLATAEPQQQQSQQPTGTTLGDAGNSSTLNPRQL